MRDGGEKRLGELKRAREERTRVVVRAAPDGHKRSVIERRDGAEPRRVARARNSEKNDIVSHEVAYGLV
jgi:hypothetical protein